MNELAVILDQQSVVVYKASVEQTIMNGFQAWISH